MKNTIFITGASSGLGRATAKLFAKSGWTVIATLRNPDNEEELSLLPNVHIIKLDINHPGDIEQAVLEAEKIAPVDVLFNNAGYVLAGALESLTDEQLEKQFSTNVLGTLKLTRAFLPYFRERKKGMIVTTTSMGAYIPEPFMAVYSATKAALEAWTEGMTFELGSFGITLKTVIPSFMKTKFVDNSDISMHPAYQEEINKVLAAFSSPEAVAMADAAEDIAEVVYQAVTDDQKKLHYFAGPDANTRNLLLSNYGIDEVLAARKKEIFEN